MTSRVSFPKILKEITKNHLASLLITVLAFVIHLITFFMYIQNTIDTIWIDEYADAASLNNTNYIMEHLRELCAPNAANIIIAMLIGVFLAYDYFRYLHSKKETDFYESLPIRRQQQFMTRFISCFVIFAVLSTLTLAIEIGIIYSTGYGDVLLIQNMLWNLFCMFGAFLAAWTTAALAMIMTGHSMIALLGFGLFYSYIPLILCNLFPVYASRFFETYMSRSQEAVANISYYFSPATLAYKLVVDYNRDGWHISRHWTYLIGIWTIALIIGTIAYLLFLRRPSETAGRAMAFEKANPIIRFLLVIPLALYLGFFLSEIASNGKNAWMIFGIVFGCFLLHAIIECIFNFDIHALFTKKKQLALAILLSFGFVSIFFFDIFGYDTYIPDAGKVNKVQIELHNVTDEALYSFWGTEQDWLYGEYVDDALLLVEDLVHENSLKVEDYDANQISFVYHMKNGSKRYRSYVYNVRNIPETLDKLSLLEEFKDDRCSLYTADRDKITSMSTSNAAEVLDLTYLSKEERNHLIDTYLREYTGLSYSKLFNSTPILQINFEHEYIEPDGKMYNTYTIDDNYYIYPEFKDTISLLESYGIKKFQESENIELANLEIYDDIYWKENGGPTYISEPEQLKELQQYMIPGDYMFYNTENEYIYCDLQIIVKDEKKYMNVCIPQNILEPYLK